MQSFGAVVKEPLPLHEILGLEPSAPLDAVTVDGLTFYEACAMGHANIAVTFLLGGFNVNACELEGQGYTGLHYAASSGNGMLCKVLIDNGAAVDAASTAASFTPLMLALSAGKPEVVQQLIVAGADPRRVDERGDPAIYYGWINCLALHTVVSLSGIKLKDLTNDAGETMLHVAAKNAGTRNTVLYLTEIAGVDVDQRDGGGETALHHACRVGDIDVVKALAQSGAAVSMTNNSGASALTMKESTHAAWLKSYAAQTSNTVRNQMSSVDASNWSNLTFKQLQHFLVPCIVPNIGLYYGSALPHIFGLAAVIVSMAGFGMVANFAMKQKGRSLATAGWFSGALILGSFVLVERIWPAFRAVPGGHPHADLVCGVWITATAVMFFSYLKAVLADPGAVKSSAEVRKDIMDAVAKSGEAGIQREGFDITTMVRKPLRAKHCSKTHHTVYRFDHYCVWTGNAIGGGNHRPFVHFSICQVISQAMVMIMTFTTLFTYGPAQDGVHPKGLAAWIEWIFNDNNAAVFYVLVVYNSFVFLFVSTVVFAQLWYATRNVTSNEVWFADRYKWMFLLGTRAYCLYDKGVWANLVEFFWTGNLCLDSQVVPVMGDHLLKKSRQYAALVKSQQQSQGPGQGGDDGGAHGHSHGGKPCHGHGEPAAPAHGHSHGGEPCHGHGEGAQGGQQAGSPVDTLQAMTAQLPADKQNEMAVVQAMLQQMIAGAAEPTLPAGFDAAKQQQMLHQVKTMHEHYQQAMGVVAAQKKA
jgi:ankyrin repeat protein